MYSVEVFPWNKNFETGLPQIDATHAQVWINLCVIAVTPTLQREGEEGNCSRYFMVEKFKV